MILIIVTTKKEPLTLALALDGLEKELISNDHLDDSEILIVGPDKETENTVRRFREKYKNISYLKDEGRGKPAALNLAFNWLKNKYPVKSDNIIVLTDGDVYIKDQSLKYLLEPFSAEGGSASGGKNQKVLCQPALTGQNRVGAVTGHPISPNNRDNIFGYWSHFLTEAAHQMRLHRKNFPCSGYLYAIRQNLIDSIPENSLSDDAVITEIVKNNKYQVVYAPESIVAVKYPDNFKDWLLQKKRSLGGYSQCIKIGERRLKINRLRNFVQEAMGGFKLFISYPRNIREYWWTIMLFLSRIYLWFLILIDIKLRKKSFQKIWQRIESTK